MEGQQGAVSKKLLKTQALHAKAAAGSSSSADRKATLPLAKINAEGQVETAIWMSRQKGLDLGSVVTYPTTNAAENAVGDPDANRERASYVITNTNALDSTVTLTALGAS